MLRDLTSKRAARAERSETRAADGLVHCGASADLQAAEARAQDQAARRHAAVRFLICRRARKGGRACACCTCLWRQTHVCPGPGACCPCFPSPSHPPLSRPPPLSSLSVSDGSGRLTTGDVCTWNRLAQIQKLPVYSETEEVAKVLKDMLADLSVRLSILEEVDAKVCRPASVRVPHPVSAAHTLPAFHALPLALAHVWHEHCPCHRRQAGARGGECGRQARRKLQAVSSLASIVLRLVWRRALTERAARRRNSWSTKRTPRWSSGRPSSSSSPTVAAIPLSAPTSFPSLSSPLPSPSLPPSRHTLARKNEKGESKGTGTQEAMHRRQWATTQEAMGHGWHTQHVLTAQHVLTHTTHTRPDADKSKEKMMQEKLEREKLNGEKDVAQSNYGTETTAYNQVLLACLSSTLFSACAQLGVRECPVPSARARAGGSGRTKHLTCVSE